MSTRSCVVHVTVFSNGSIIPTGFKFTELHTLTLAARSYVLLSEVTALFADILTKCLKLCLDDHTSANNKQMLRLRPNITDMTKLNAMLLPSTGKRSKAWWPHYTLSPCIHILYSRKT